MRSMAWKKRLIKTAIIMAVILALAGSGGYFFLKQAKFGRNPEGSHLSEISLSSNYRDGEFRNITERPRVINQDSAVKSFAKYLFAKKERVPTMKADLKNLDAKNIVVWLGHSSYYFQLNGRTILVDPVLSDHAAPVSFANKAFAGATPYSPDDFPEIDYLLITHDHWDHLDYPTVMALKGRIKNIVVPLGVGSHFLHWGFPLKKIREADWNQQVAFDGLTIHILPAQHYSGRWLERNKTLWAAFALVAEPGPDQSSGSGDSGDKAAATKIFISGDTGYGPHFREIGRALGGFDLALLDSGQYDPNWPYIHMTPEEAVAAANDLNAKALLPAHIGKFSLANHSWDDPFVRISSALNAAGEAPRLFTPVIGRPINLDDQNLTFDKWWEPLNK